MRSVDEGKEYSNRIGLPILYIARHCLELGFKANIRYFQKYSEKDDHVNSSSHSLFHLFNAFKVHITQTIKNLKDKHGIDIDDKERNEFKSYLKDCDNLVGVFEELDKFSFAFRYPVDVNGKMSFKSTDHINL